MVQSLCLLNQPWLDRQSIEAGLSPTDQAELRLLVRPERWRHEAEARVMANKPVQVYLDEFDRACPHQPLLESDQLKPAIRQA